MFVRMNRISKINAKLYYLANPIQFQFCSVEMGHGHRAENGTPAFQFHKDCLGIFRRQ